MSRHQPGTVICIIDINRVPIEALFLTMDTIRRGIYKPSDSPLALVLQGKTPLIHLPLTDTHNNPCLGENNLRLRNVKISFGKTFNLILQVSHLLIFLSLHFFISTL